ncbi:MAG: leucine-rich repeat protein [Clostridia bacterium]|nr:leucine-rich repeat protein [Clostridia bacterium]
MFNRLVRFFSLVLCLSIFYSMFSFSASMAEDISSGICGDNVFWTLDEDGVLLISGSGPMYDYTWRVIGFNIDMATVEIDMPSYSNNKINKIIIEDGVTSIGNRSFCSLEFTEISIPESVTTIGEEAFGSFTLYSIYLPEDINISGCPFLTSITIPDSVISIGKRAFAGCNNLSEIVFGKHIDYIGQEAFDDTAWYNEYPDGIVYAGSCLYKYKNSMPNNTELVIKDGTTCISDYAFYNYENLVSVIIPKSVIKIGENAFENCTKLININMLGQNLESIGSNAFKNCKKLNSLTIPDSVTSIGSNAFENCTNLSTIILSKNLSSINSYLFNKCESMISIIIPSNVSSIGEYAFNGCKNLTTITIPTSVVEIGSYAFNRCSKLENVYFLGSLLQWDRLNTSLSKDVVHCAYIGSGTCGENLNWYLDNNGLLVINGFGEMTSVPWANYKGFIKRVTFADGMTSIADFAFSNCTFEENIIFPNELSFIGASAFLGSKGITKIELSKNAVLIGCAAFYNCVDLEEIILNDGIVNLQENTFFGCSNLKNVTFPKSLNFLADNAFQYCIAITDVYYHGTEEEWESIVFGEGNQYIQNANVHFGVYYFKTGDVDNDGSITASDARLALGRAVDLETFPVGSAEYTACDVDNDGSITASDARLILRAAVGLETL